MQEYFFRFQVGPCIVQEITNKLNECIAFQVKAGTECVYGTATAAAFQNETDIAPLIKRYIGWEPEFLILRLQ
jgi:hypothetical protein